MDGVLKMTQKPLNALIAGLMALGLSQAALAANSVPFPQLADPEAACQALTADNPRAYNVCLDPQQRGYDTAKALWDQLSQRSAEFCAASASRVIASGQYEALGYCAALYRQVDEQNAPPHSFQW